MVYTASFVTASIVPSLYIDDSTNVVLQPVSSHTLVLLQALPVNRAIGTNGVKMFILHVCLLILATSFMGGTGLILDQFMIQHLLTTASV